MASHVIIPGDQLPIDTSEASVQSSIGPGVYKLPRNHTLIPASAGILHINENQQNSKKVVYIDSDSKRYIPQMNDFVIGIIIGVFGENYKVQLQDFSQAVQLSMMAFPNASRKNRPNLKVGQVVYARVSQAVPEIDVELECIDATTGKEGGFGLLDESGYIFDVHLNFARELLFNLESTILEKLASKCEFEIAVGINGKVWLKCGSGIPINRDAAGNTTTTSSSENDDANTQKGDVTVDSSYINNLRTTLAACRYIERCQHVPNTEFDVELKKLFKF